MKLSKVAGCRGTERLFTCSKYALQELPCPSKVPLTLLQQREPLQKHRSEGVLGTEGLFR